MRVCLSTSLCSPFPPLTLTIKAHRLPADGEPRVALIIIALFLPRTQIHVVTPMNREREIFIDIKRDPKPLIITTTTPVDTLSNSFITVALLVVALSGNKKNAHFMAYKSVENKVLTGLSKNLNTNSLIETAALWCIR